MPILTRRFGASTFEEVFTRLSIELLLPLAFLFLDSLLPRVFLWLRGWYGFRCRLCTVVTLMLETTLATSNHCTLFDFLMSGVKISQSKFLIYTSLHHGFSTFDTWEPISSDEPPCRTILIRF